MIHEALDDGSRSRLLTTTFNTLPSLHHATKQPLLAGYLQFKEIAKGCDVARHVHIMRCARMPMLELVAWALR